MKGIFLALSGLLLAGCASAPADKLTWREAFNLVVLDQSGMWMDAQVSRSNTGLLRGQGHLAVTIFPLRDSQVELRRIAPPQAVTFDADNGSIRLAQDRLELGTDGWTFHVREGADALDATIHLVPAAAELQPATLVEGQRQWMLGVPVTHGQVTGAWRAGKQGGLIRGHGLLVRQSTDTWPGAQPSRSSLYMITPNGSVGVEQVAGTTLSWIAGPDGVRHGSTASITREGRTLQLSLEPDLPVSATLRLGSRSISRLPWDHLLPVEGLLARIIAGQPQRTYERGRAQLTVDSERVVTSALLIHGDPAPDKRRRRAVRAEE